MEFYMAISADVFEPSHAADACNKFLLFYSALGREASAKGMDLHWKVKPKFHMFAEMAQYQT
eukprot:1994509-Alexandrium_andersonii.AAC.1